eukprot:GHVU01015207.1.p1 GENE.GHVU01015207.1~~GHVU01015207.1.p1  ORF type:complete len:157 (+),score=14.47 GHVU01015207.1:559-1029(+)
MLAMMTLRNWHTCAYVCVHAHTCAYVCVHAHTCVYVCVHAQTYVYVCVHAHTCVCHHQSISGEDVVAIRAGAMHTVVLCANGTLMSWGCNDDKALGRPTPRPAPEDGDDDDEKEEREEDENAVDENTPGQSIGRSSLLCGRSLLWIATKITSIPYG